jgi:DNA-binding transcriptional ArsR family regulator
MFDVDKFRIAEKNIDSIESKKKYVPNKGGVVKFIKGPIPLPWIIGAVKLSPCALRISIVIWYVRGLRKSDTFILSNKMLKEFGLDRYTKYRGLKLLEEAGLVEVKRRSKRNPMVTIKKASIYTQ